MVSAYVHVVGAGHNDVTGEIVHVKVFDKHIMILNTVEAMNEIFDKRSALYSDRPRLPMLNEL